ncbi:hypothetical protein DFS34DRAFT_605400 [Phlyctochytrium arcticum]|nr:hypothetical protein DFS34DRAFT_605400 [Phlyctochytrium arcticum]
MAMPGWGSGNSCREVVMSGPRRGRIEGQRRGTGHGLTPECGVTRMVRIRLALGYSSAERRASHCCLLTMLLLLLLMVRMLVLRMRGSNVEMRICIVARWILSLRLIWFRACCLGHILLRQSFLCLIRL